MIIPLNISNLLYLTTPSITCSITPHRRKVKPCKANGVYVQYKYMLLTPVVEGCEGMEETVVCWVATEDDLCCSSTVFTVACW